MRFIEFNLKYQGFCIGPHYDNEVLSFSLCSYENGTKNVIKSWTMIILEITQKVWGIM